MTFSDETLMAYADGELDAHTRAAVERAAAQDPQLAERIARHRALRTRLQSAFEPALDEAVPARLLEPLREPPPRHTGNVVPLRRNAPPHWSWREWSAIAASLAIGALLGPQLLRSAGAPLALRGGQLTAGGTLGQALSGQLAAGQPSGAPVQVGVSFRAHGGEYCRTFVLRDAGALAGVACRDRDAWRIAALAATQEGAGQPGAYRPAASALPPAVARAVDEMISGEPLDAHAEAAARARHWTP